MNKKRLLKLADFLETVPTKNFAIQAWVAHHATEPEGEKPGECGFAGCAMGWAVHAKLFRGLKFGTDCVGSPSPVYENREGFAAACRLLQIEHNDSLHLFSGTGYLAQHPTPKQVANRIRKFVESGHV